MEKKTPQGKGDKEGPIDWVDSLKTFVKDIPTRMPEEIEKETDEEFLKIM